MKVGILFDLDGVLIDSEREYSRIWSEIESHYPTGIEDYALKIKGQTLTKILTDNYPDETIREEVRVMLHQLEREMSYYYCLGAEQLLDDLCKEGIPCAIVTSSDDVKMRHLFADVPSIKGKVGIIIDSTKVTRSKPDPEGYLLGADALGVDIRHCAVVEDSVQGVKAGRASGAYVIGVIGTKTREELAPYCDFLVDSLSQIDITTLRNILEKR